MSYLSFPRLDFFGTFRADPSTVNNSPDNFNPNNQFPPNEGSEIDKNIQLYWNPNGTGAFELDCKVNKVYYADGSTATSPQQDIIINQALVSLHNNSLPSAKVVDLDPMQQNVTELWGLNVGIGPRESLLMSGAFKPAAYSNAWVQVVNGRGDYAGSAFYQSVLDLKDLSPGDSHFLKSLKKNSDGSLPQLSISFTLRSFNSSSPQYLVSQNTIFEMNKQGIPSAVTDKLLPLKKYNQKSQGKGTPGLIPTTLYFEKLLSMKLLSMNLPKAEYKKYEKKILAIAFQGPYVPKTDYEFTHGQVFGSIGLHSSEEPDFMTPNRMLSPTAIVKTGPPIQVPTDEGAYKGYFAPFKLNNYKSPEGPKHYVTVNLGNSLPSTQPASNSNSFVDEASLGNLHLCCFPKGISGKPVILGKIAYQKNDFYTHDAGIVDIPIEDGELLEKIEKNPLAIVSIGDYGEVEAIILHENPKGLYLRANQFVYRMNPGTKVGSLNPETADVEFYVSKFGRPISDMEIEVSMLSSSVAATYSNHTLGTGGTTGMVNMSVPTSAVELEGKASTPVTIKTGANGVATLSIKSLNPGNPRGYMDGQIYFLKYGFTDESIQETYIQSPDDLVSLQVYEAQPAIEDITWANFVQPVLGQYAKIYPVMSFLDMGNEASVINNAQIISTQLTTSVKTGGYMPVTRDMSQSRLNLIVKWLSKYI